MKDFPIMGDPERTSIPWVLIAPHQQQAYCNHGQSLLRLAQRGGLAPCEAVAVLEGRKWRHMRTSEASKRLGELLKAWADAQLGRN